MTMKLKLNCFYMLKHDFTASYEVEYFLLCNKEKRTTVEEKNFIFIDKDEILLILDFYTSKFYNSFIAFRLKDGRLIYSTSYTKHDLADFKKIA